MLERTEDACLPEPLCDDGNLGAQERSPELISEEGIKQGFLEEPLMLTSRVSASVVSKDVLCL